jgi:HAE1 family hydrophobic/amphiphilic exporter-1
LSDGELGQVKGSSLARFSVRSGVLVNILFLICLLAGTYVARTIAVDAYPNVDLDAAAIYTIWIGASPDEIDNLVTSPIEDELAGIVGIDRVVSDSRPNRSTILVKFREDLSDDEVDRAFQDIRAALERVDDLPDDVERPYLHRQTIFEIFPLISIAVAYDDPAREPVAREVARELREDLLDIDGISKIEDRNIREPEFTVFVDRERAERFDVTLEEVVTLLRATNRNIPAGEVGGGVGVEAAVKAAGNYKSIAELEQTVIRQDPGGAHVRVRDIARVVAGFEKRDVKSRFNGREAIVLPVAKEEGRNSLELVDAVRAHLDKVRERGLPAGIELGVPLDSSQIIRDRLSILLSNLAGGIVLVFLALWAGIGVRNAALAVIGIPFCYLVAVMFMETIGVSVNAISLFAMVLVSGVIVDDALIVLENIYRHLEEKMPLREAVIRGASEVFWPVFSSTLTTMAAFLPMLIMVGVTGEFFSIIPKVVTVTLIASAFECFVVLPVHYLHFGQRLRRLQKDPGRVSPMFKVFARLRPAYERLLVVVLKHRYAAFICLISAAVVAVALAGTLDTLLFPSDFQVFVVNMEMPTDSSLAQTEEASRAVDAVLQRVNSEGPFANLIEGWNTSIGAVFTDDNYLLLAPHRAQCFVSLRQGTAADPVAIKDYTGELLRQVRDEPRDAEEERIAAGLRIFEKLRAQPQNDGPPTGKPVAVRIRCDDLDRAEQVAGEIKAYLATVPGVDDISDNHDEGRIEYSFALKRALAAAQGVTFERIAGTLAAANDGVVVSVFKDPGGVDDADVRVRLEGKDRGVVTDLGLVRIRNRFGEAVPLHSLAELKAERSHAGIYRYDGRRTVLVTANVDEKVATATSVNHALQRQFDTAAFRAANPDLALRFGGEFEETQKSFASLGQAFNVALLAIYMILATQFHSYLLPMLILLTVPFAFIGVVVGLFITGNPFTIMAGIAMVGLAGIAVNDAIVLVDFINRRRLDGVPTYEAVLEGCRLRARPILLTSVTTIAGLLPMAMGLTGFSKLWSPFASTICFGILFATALTLLIIPAGYLAVEDLKGLVARWRRRGTPDAEPADVPAG